MNLFDCQDAFAADILVCETNIDVVSERCDRSMASDNIHARWLQTALVISY